MSSDLEDLLFLDHTINGGCVQKAGPWAAFQLTFAFGHLKFVFDWWDSRLETHHFFRESVSFTATTNSNPSDSDYAVGLGYYWSEFKTERDSSLCIGIKYGHTHNGNLAAIEHCGGTWATLWFMDDLGRIRSRCRRHSCH